jgi:hypothetical protein
MVWQYALGAARFPGSAGAAHCGEEQRQTLAWLSRTFALPGGRGNGAIERAKPIRLWVDCARKALPLFWLSHSG